MMNEKLAVDARVTAANLLGASTRGPVTLCPEFARSLSVMLQQLADRIGPDAPHGLADVSSAGIRSGRAMERDEIAAMLQAEADQAGTTQREDRRCGNWKKAAAAGAVAAALETLAQRIKRRA